ncbi:TIGR03667 family PPOX class F420-dependent oxidoreductase [Mycolicibacterium diernhoferi]|uniref:PPOX class F420-dependent oxidoreductase n=1 Tax=Mycolicibacterium diernhoferi TaxID=1801 RepID=A0A1Q4HF53_9MYCO|nr:TIGR03667 family PPOX class F420-dependent oxidoreductase [Mycolicibacterium diernhoferi]OJZ66148.1 PPOX class F420-dependent oxidoreductase [Mycolicibacterium diernhoferi]OPE47050.1 PPOX class F420-dependent oxidoreductase [Mycolicibacterium diernhoferi]PEG51432.1 TIGR03667 family PPOX class F420-dependent oxidoreductase [Mycolicibacterium diernhoferi]QYL24058.1 TIGR03667 family PPOX class F420-dependent oxidoreductase [Mycolicibacterium diernhoferi]
MTANLTQEVTERLVSDHYGWLTTVTKSGMPVPKLVWFFFDGAEIVVYTAPGSAKVRHVREHPQVSLNLDSDGHGGGIIVLGGQARVDAEDADPREDGSYWAKYGPAADQFGLTESMSGYGARLRISIDKVWTTPEA